MNLNRFFEARMDALPMMNVWSAVLALFLLAGVAPGQELAAPTIGYAEPFRIITVSAGEPGVISEMLVKEGETVKERQVLARLETDVLASELDIARAEAAQEEKHVARLKELVAASRVTPEEIDKAQTDLVIRQARVRKFEAMIETRTMRSPVDGVVSEIKRDVAESVSSATPDVLTVVQIDRLALNLYLPPAASARLKEGGQAHVRFIDTGQTTTATIEFVSPVIDPASGTVRVKLVIENGDGRFRSGGRCSLAADEK